MGRHVHCFSDMKDSPIAIRDRHSISSAQPGIGFSLTVAALLAVLSIPATGFGREAHAAKKQMDPATQTASFGPVVPGAPGAPAAVVVPFRLSISRATAALGYRVTAVSSFAFTAATSAAGGKSVTPADLLVGITGVSSTLGTGANTSISTGFDYDPTAVTGTGGINSLTGTAAARATVADLVSGRELLRSGKITSDSIPAAGGDLTFSLRIAAPNQFFTPGSFTGTITVIVSQ